MAHAAGVALSVDHDDLVLDAPSEPPSVVLDLLRQHKAGVVTLLQRGLRVRYCRWSAEDWQLFFNERAGIAEFDGGAVARRGRGERIRSLRRRVAEP